MRMQFAIPLIFCVGICLAQAPFVPRAAAQRSPVAHARPVLPIPLQPNLPTIFLIGDTGVRDGKGDGSGGLWGWGEPFVHFFDLARVNVTNRALDGPSSRTYLTEGFWDETRALIKPGDIVIIQFGNNDGGQTPETDLFRRALEGIGDDTQEGVNPFTHKMETVHSFGWYLRKYIAETRARKATPILCTPVPRNIWKNGHIERPSAPSADWTRQVANAEHVSLLDLNERIATRYEMMGPEKVDALFAHSDTHTSLAGAEVNAEMVVAALKALSSNPVAGYFNGNAPAIQPSTKAIRRSR